jgi:hypothetical protein
MTPNYSFARVDLNHAEIRRIVRKAGYVWVDSFRAGLGVPDAFVISKSGRWVAFEVKSEDGELTPAEQILFDSVGNAPLFTVTSAEGALEILAFYDKKGD